MLTFVKAVYENEQHCMVWEAQCDCGNLTYIVPSRHDIKSCGCLKHKIKDFTGQTFGRLTFIKPIEEKKYGKTVWELLCSCGTIIYKTAEVVSSGNTKSCGCYKHEVSIRTGKILASKALGKTRKHTPYMSSVRAVWGMTYKDCPLEVFMMVSQQNCHYCGVLPTNCYNVANRSPNEYNSTEQALHGNFIYNGLDRKDSSLGHTMANVVPCCWPCNRAKGSMGYREFLDHIDRMYNHTTRMNYRQQPSLEEPNLSATG